MRGVVFSEGTDTTDLEQTENKKIVRVVLEFRPHLNRAPAKPETSPWRSPADTDLIVTV